MGMATKLGVLDCKSDPLEGYIHVFSCQAKLAGDVRLCGNSFPLNPMNISFFWLLSALGFTSTIPQYAKPHSFLPQQKLFEQATQTKWMKIIRTNRTHRLCCICVNSSRTNVYYSPSHKLKQYYRCIFFLYLSLFLIGNERLN